MNTQRLFSIFTLAALLLGVAAYSHAADQNIAVTKKESPAEVDLISFRNRIDAILTDKIRQSLDRNIFPDNATAFFANGIKINETKNQYIYKIDVPTTHRDHLKVLLRNNSIVLLNQSESPSKKGRLMAGLGQINTDVFHRIIPLPTNADMQSISPIDQDGVLIISVNKI